MMTAFDQFLLETPALPAPVPQPILAQGELFNRLMLRGLPVMKPDMVDEKPQTLH